MRRIQLSIPLVATVLGCVEPPETGPGSQGVRGNHDDSALGAEGGIATLADAAASAQRRVGAAVAHDPLIGEPSYAHALAVEFGDVTPENETKWGSLQTEP